MNNKTIYPTGTCFDDAFELIEYFLETNPDVADDLRLVHGIAHFPDHQPEEGGRPFAHGWLELKDVVWHKGILCGLKVAIRREIDEFYELHRIDDFTEYTMKQTWENNVKHGNYGPWEERYSALCRNQKIKKKRRLKAGS